MVKEANRTCPACGFVTFNMQEDRDEFCSVCKWQDDPVQQSYPASLVGANKVSLCEYQRKLLLKYPIEIRVIEEFT